MNAGVAAESLAGLLEVRSRIVAAGRWVEGPSSLMGVLGQAHHEVRNCLVVRWLLDPLAPHRIGAQMIESLGTYLAVELGQPDLARVEVEVSRDHSRADVVVSGADDAWTVVIEAKIDAAEGIAQAARLERDWPDATRLVFLTRRGVEIPITSKERGRWRPLSWNWFASTSLDAMTLDGPVEEPRVEEARHAITAWAVGVERDLR